MNEPGFSVLRPRLHQSVKAFMDAAVLPASTTLMEGPAGAPPTTDWAAGETAGSNGSWYFGESARLARDRPMTAMATRSQMPYTDPRILVLLGECLVTVLLGCVLIQAETVSQNEYKKGWIGRRRKRAGGARGAAREPGFFLRTDHDNLRNTGQWTASLALPMT